MKKEVLRERNKVKLKEGLIGYLSDTGSDYSVHWGVSLELFGSIIRNNIKLEDIEEVIEYFDWQKELEKYK